jgi:hypothetical protein
MTGSGPACLGEADEDTADGLVQLQRVACVHATCHGARGDLVGRGERELNACGGIPFGYNIPPGGYRKW